VIIPLRSGSIISFFVFHYLPHHGPALPRHRSDVVMSEIMSMASLIVRLRSRRSTARLGYNLRSCVKPPMPSPGADGFAATSEV